MKIYSPMTVLIPNNSQKSIFINGKELENDKLVLITLDNKLIEKNLLLLNPIQKSSSQIELKIFNLNSLQNDSNAHSLIFGLLTNKNTIKIDEGIELAEIKYLT